MENLATLIDPSRIAALPWHIGIPGMLVILLLVLSAIRSALSLRPVRAITRIILALAIAIILTQGGDAIASLTGTPPGS
jgi:uncharacterized membrane protein